MNYKCKLYYIKSNKLGALDSNTSKDILQIMSDLNEEGKTIVMITHDLDIANKADRQIRIKNGKID